MSDRTAVIGNVVFTLATQTTETNVVRSMRVNDLAGEKIVITGAAGLVGQNLIPLLKTKGYTNIIAIDKNVANSAILKRFHPDIHIVLADLADPFTVKDWADELAGCKALVVGHAQIGGSSLQDYVRNNQNSTERLLEVALRHNVPYLVNISSAAVMSAVENNDYSDSKRAQENMVRATGIKQVVLRPSLMFGWFDRKHMGWLANFMRRVPVFPIPGNGAFVRQPLYVNDLCAIIAASIEREMTGEYNITGQETIDYIDLIKTMRKVIGAKVLIVRIPYKFFACMLRAYGLFTKNPVFTVKQMEMLMTPDLFEVIDWPSIFGVRSTPLQQALDKTYSDPTYSKIILKF